MATVAVYSLKGGVGKTTLAVNLAWCAATLSARRTLLWDLDPQGASTFLLNGTSGKVRAQAVFSKEIELARLIQSTAIDRLELIGADASLRGLDRLFHELGKKRRLAKLLGQLDQSHDRILLDCAPGLTDTSEQVMRAADLIVVPVVPSPLSQRALAEVEAHLGGKLKGRLMPVHSMVDRRRKLHAQTVAAHPEWPVIPVGSIVETMAAHRAPLGAFAGRTGAANAFAALWQAIERRLAQGGRA